MSIADITLRKQSTHCNLIADVLVLVLVLVLLGVRCLPLKQKTGTWHQTHTANAMQLGSHRDWDVTPRANAILSRLTLMHGHETRYRVRQCLCLRWNSKDATRKAALVLVFAWWDTSDEGCGIYFGIRLWLASKECRCQISSCSISLQVAASHFEGHQGCRLSPGAMTSTRGSTIRER